MFGLSSLTTKIIIGAVVTAVVMAAFLSYRSALIEQGYNDAKAEYEPKVLKAEAEAADWKIATERWQVSFASLNSAVGEQNAAIQRMNDESEARYKATKKALDEAQQATAKAREEARSEAYSLVTMKLPPGKCDAYQSLVSAARGRLH